jgi:hypothetical protein
MGEENKTCETCKYQRKYWAMGTPFVDFICTNIYSDKYEYEPLTGEPIGLFSLNESCELWEKETETEDIE